MIKKIVDWTVGSFFRTIGRLLVFVIIGFLVAKLVDFSNIKWTDLLGIETVKASSWESVWIPQTVKYQINNSAWNNTTLTGSYFHTISLMEGTAKYRFLFTSQKTLSSNDNAMYFNVKIHMRDDDLIVFDDTLYSNQVCQNTDSGFICAYDITGEIWQTKYSANFSYRYNVNGTVYYRTCFPYASVGETFTFKCPVSSDAIDGVEVSIDSTTTTGKYDIGIYYLYNIEKNDTQSIIDNQNQIAEQQQSQHNETMSYFQDDNTTSSEDEASSFFDDFSVTDHGGLSSILTAPLTIVSKVLDDTCTPATFTYRNKQVVLPCGQYFWNQAPELRDWLSTIESGIIAYAILVALFKMIQKLESPSNSEVEVESL